MWQVGVLDMDESTISAKGRLGPGMMISVDLETGEVRSPSLSWHLLALLS